ncbi:MAG: PHP domain-containing protein [Chthoniobacterales bacterium]|nr:PHP domain-containing protein [Chthoniobacterales bacterium]
MLLNFDIHVHSWYSADATDSPEELILAARRAGLHGIAITDHDNCQVHDYLQKRGLERPDGRPVDDFLILPGTEVSTAEGHLLCIGATLPTLRGEPSANVLEQIQKRGAIAIPAHPFDGWRAGIPSQILDSLPLTTIETFNAAVTSPIFNLKAKEYARRRSLAATAASDAHHASSVATAFISLELDEFSLNAVLHALRNPAAIHRTERYLTLRQAIQKHLANWFRFLKQKKPSSLSTHTSSTPIS